MKTFLKIFAVVLGVVLIVILCSRDNGSSHNNSAKSPSKQSSVSYGGSSTSHSSGTKSGTTSKPAPKKADDTYANNSLSTGATPYSDWYGGNYYGLSYNYSTVKVTAPTNSDVVVIIKKNNQYGDVAAHGYIRSGATLSLDLPNGTYQTFFYYGKGWNPNKQMEGVRGGFSRNEVFSKANSESLYDVELSYVLQLTTNGNFSTKRSSSSEIF